MSEPWTTKQHLWVVEQYTSGRKVGEFWQEFEPLFGVKRTKCAFYQYMKKIAREDGNFTPLHRTEWTEEEITRLVKLHGVMKVPGTGEDGWECGRAGGEDAEGRNVGEEEAGTGLLVE